MFTLVLLVRSESGEKGKLFKQELEPLDFGKDMVLLQDLKSLKRYLTTPGNFGESQLFVLFADSRECLTALLGFSALFEGRRLLLVLPDSDPDTLSLGHKLWPRFFTFIKDDYKDLCSVIQQIQVKGEKNA